MPSLIQKMRRNLRRWGMSGPSRAEKVALAKRELERKLMADGLSRSQAKTAVSVRFGQGRQ